MAVLFDILSLIVVMAVWRVLVRPFPLKDFHTHRFNATFFVFGCFLTWLAYLNQPEFFSTWAAIGVALISYCNMFTARLSDHSRLLVQPALFSKHHAHVHLKSPSDKFTLQTYKELPEVLNWLTEYGYGKALLTSPMLAKNGVQRSTGTLTKVLGINESRIKSKVIPFWRVPLATSTILFDKYVKRCPTLKNTSAFHWVCIEINLKRVSRKSIDEPDENILYASCYSTLDDISKTEACKGKTVHCAFGYNTYMEMQQPLERNLIKQGVKGLYFHEVGLIYF